MGKLGRLMLIIPADELSMIKVAKSNLKLTLKKLKGWLSVLPGVE